MKDKHINIAEDSRLMKLVYQEVAKELIIDSRKTAFLLAIKFAFYMVLVAGCYFWIIQAGSELQLFVAYIIFGLCAVLLGFNFAHDFSHNTVFDNKSINHWGFVFIYTILGAHAEAWRYRHIHSHHYAPNVKDYDSDLQITDLIRVEPNSTYRWFHRYQHWYAPIAYTSYSIYWVFIKDFVIYFNGSGGPGSTKWSFHVSFWIQKLVYVVYLLILPLMLSDFDWYFVVLAFLSMHAVQSLFLLLTFFMTHHVETTSYYEPDDKGYIPESWFMNQVKSSNDFYPFSHTANFIFGGFNNHVAHHLFPHIHHIHYPQLNRILYRVLRSHQIEPNVTGFFTGIYSHLSHLKIMSRQPRVAYS